MPHADGAAGAMMINLSNREIDIERTSAPPTSIAPGAKLTRSACGIVVLSVAICAGVRGTNEAHSQ